MKDVDDQAIHAGEFEPQEAGIRVRIFIIA
jgi:hypothetical protein